MSHIFVACVLCPDAGRAGGVWVPSAAGLVVQAEVAADEGVVLPLRRVFSSHGARGVGQLLQPPRIPVDA